MKLNFIKNGLIAGLLFAAQKAGAQMAPEYGMPREIATLYGVAPVYDEPAFVGIVTRLVIPLLFIFISLSAIVSPIIGFRWYIKHGGTKKWIGWVACFPLLIALGIIFGYVLSFLIP